MNSKQQPKILIKTRESNDPSVGASSSGSKRTPTILKAAASSNAAPHGQQTQKSGTKIENKQPTKTAAPTDPYCFTPMDRSVVLLKNQLNYRMLDFLHDTNQDYVVVGVIGGQGVGKSTVLNMVNRNLYSKKSKETPDNVFPVHEKLTIFGENEVRLFITEDRLILLDSTEPLISHTRKDFIQHEQEELKRMMILLRLCHVILIVQEEWYNIRLMRTLMWAEMMSQFNPSTHQRKLVFIKNKVVPHCQASECRVKMLRLYKNMFNGTKIFSTVHRARDADQSKGNPEVLNFVELPLLEKGDAGAEMSQNLKDRLLYLRNLVYGGRQTIMANNCSEKAWGQALVKLVDGQDGNLFNDRYDKLKDKYNLHNHIKIMDHPYRDALGGHHIE
ncbi:nonsense-mediated mRNA decay factor SMG9 [Anopheles bellator]|uniref:nonsense-mediated mRNA decay factor SMG9 n=1 Tax=Anopheles bellator TaxID=139047 RepID=UPI0026473745|nr:nonsense-mediated mRNA decay factor SMG9 [Anopheles bellator]